MIDFTMNLIYHMEVTEMEAGFIHAALKTDFQGYGVAAVLKMAEEGRVQIWRLSGDKSFGILVTQLNAYPAGTEVFMWLLGGRNLQQHAVEIIENVKKFGAANGASWIRSASLPTVAKMIKARTGLQTCYEVLMEEI